MFVVFQYFRIPPPLEAERGEEHPWIVVLSVSSKEDSVLQ